MADNVAITAGSGTTIATDDIGGVQYQRVKVTWGPDATANDADVASGKPLPVQLRSATGTAITPITPDVGSGTGGSATQRVIVDSAQLASVQTTAQAMSAGYQLVALATDQSFPVGTTGFMKKEDVAAADGDAGVAMMAVRQSSPANTSNTNGDYEMLQMNAGRLWTSNSAEATEVHLGEVGGKSAYRVITMSTDTGAYGSGDLIADTQQYDGFFRKTDGTGVINTLSITEKDAQGAAYYVIFHRTSTSMGTENSAPNISDANLVAGIQHIVAVATSDFVSVSGTKIATLRNLGLPVMAVSGTDDLYISILNSTGTPTYASGEIQLGIGVLLD